VEDAVTTVANTVVDTFNTVVQAAATAVQTVVGVASALVKFIATGMYALSQTITLDLTPNNQNSPFGPAYTIYQSSGSGGAGDTSEIEEFTQLLTSGPTSPGVQVYCVNCGITGQIGITGSISASLTDGVKQAMIGTGANFQAGQSFHVGSFT
jgi:hypothetical protein